MTLARCFPTLLSGLVTQVGFGIVVTSIAVGTNITPSPALAGEALPLRGVVRALHQASISSEIVTPVLAVGFREGQRFAAGDTLLTFDCRRPRHDLAALDATVSETRVAVEANTHLTKGGAGNRTDLAVAEARHAKAVAEYKSMRQRLEGCQIVAPYAGVVTELSISAFETPQVNRPLLTIASDTAIEIELIVPSRMLPMVQTGRALHFTADETGRAYRATINRTGGAIDPASQTVKLFADFADAADGILPGMSGTAIFITTGG